jgi:hypothetical protein
MSLAFALSFTLSLHDAGEEDISMEEEARLIKMKKLLITELTNTVYTPFYKKWNV